MAGGAKLAFMVSPFSSTSAGSAWIPEYLIVGIAEPDLPRAPTAAKARFPATPDPGDRASHKVAAAAAASPFSRTAPLVLSFSLLFISKAAKDVESSSQGAFVEGVAATLREMCPAPMPSLSATVPVAVSLPTAGASPVIVVLERQVMGVSVGAAVPGSGGGGSAPVQIALKNGFFTTSVCLLWIFSHTSFEIYR